MEKLRYTVIKSPGQYNQYCKALEKLMDVQTKNKIVADEIELLTFLIEKYDEQQDSQSDIGPIDLVLSLMKDHHLKAKDMVEILGISKGYVSDILHYKKSLSKEVIRKLSERFKIKQEAFNRPYPLKLGQRVSAKSNSAG